MREGGTWPFMDRRPERMLPSRPRRWQTRAEGRRSTTNRLTWQSTSYTFNSRSAWETAAGASALPETFDSIGVDTLFRQGSPPVVLPDFALASIALGDNDFLNLIDVLGDDFGTYAVGLSAPVASMFVNGDAGPGLAPYFVEEVELSLTVPVSAWGTSFSLEGFFDPEGVQIELDSGGGTLDTLFITDGLATIEGAFFGFNANAGEQVSTILFQSTRSDGFASGQPFAIDDVVGVPIPEPASGALVFALVGAVAGRCLRRRASTSG